LKARWLLDEAKILYIKAFGMFHPTRSLKIEAFRQALSAVDSIANSKTGVVSEVQRAGDEAWIQVISKAIVDDGAVQHVLGVVGDYPVQLLQPKALPPPSLPSPVIENCFASKAEAINNLQGREPGEGPEQGTSGRSLVLDILWKGISPRAPGTSREEVLRMGPCEYQAENQVEEEEGYVKELPGGEKWTFDAVGGICCGISLARGDEEEGLNSVVSISYQPHKIEENQKAVLATTWDGSNYSLYVDGVLIDTKPLQGETPDLNQLSIRIGEAGTPSDPEAEPETGFLSGEILNLKIYPEHLNGSQIEALSGVVKKKEQISPEEAMSIRARKMWDVSEAVEGVEGVAGVEGVEGVEILSQDALNEESRGLLLGVLRRLQEDSI